MKRVISIFLLVMLVMTGIAASQSAKTKLVGEQAELFNDVSDRLVCQCSCLMILRICNHQNCPSAVPMRMEIERQIVADVPADSIVASFVSEYGMVVLSSPPTEGLNLAAWIMPGFFILVGLLLIVHYAGHWMSRRKLAAEAPVPPIDPEIRERIERELREVDK